MTTTADRTWWVSIPAHTTSPRCCRYSVLTQQLRALADVSWHFRRPESDVSSLQKLGYKHRERPKKLTPHRSEYWFCPLQVLWMFAPECFCSSWGWKGISLARSLLVSFFCSDPIVLKHNGAEFSIVPLGLYQNWNQHWKVCCVMLLPALNTVISAKKQQVIHIYAQRTGRSFIQAPH